MSCTEAAIVLVHGLWVNGLDMALLRYRLVRYGFDTYQFSYRSVRDAPATNAERLAGFIRTLDHPVVHFIGHSLGGIVIRHYFAGRHDHRPGRIVTLGTPHQSSQAARALLRFRPTRRLLGKSVQAGLAGAIPPWEGRCELGSIAGSVRLGLGLMMAGVPQPSDGTVAVAETRLENMADHLIIRASHLGLLLSRQAAWQCEHFLRQGRFEHGGGRSAEDKITPREK